MNRRSFLKSANVAGLALALPVTTFAAEEKKSSPTTAAAPNPKSILLKDYRPVSIYKVPVTRIDKAKFPIIDMHSHPYPKTDAEITTWLKNMDAVNVEKTMILTMTTGKAFDDYYAKYSQDPDRFEVWCGLDFTGYKTPAFPDSAVKELERCKEKGAKGIGEIHDKGQGLHSGKSNAPGLHPDDPRMDNRLGESRRTPHARQPPRSRSHLDVPAHGQAQRRPDECFRMAARQSAEHR